MSDKYGSISIEIKFGTAYTLVDINEIDFFLHFVFYSRLMLSGLSLRAIEI